MSPSAPPARRPRVVIVGAGFAGLWTERGLRRTECDVTLVDRHNFHTFFPLLYQVAAAELGPIDIAYPIRAVLRGSNADFQLGEVRAVDLEARRIRTDGGELDYDVLVLAMGSVPAFFGVDGADEHAFPLRDMTHAIPLRRHILLRYEAAAVEPDPERRRALLTFVIVGGGPTGVEYAGALAELVHGPLVRDYPSIDDDEARIVLLEGGERVLSTMDDSLSNYALARLRTRRVDVRLNTMVTRIRADGVDLAEGGPIPAHTVVWTAGIQGDPRVAEWGLPIARGGRVAVEPTLQVVGHPEVFVAGDLAGVTGDDGRLLPQVAPVAVQEGRHLGTAITAFLRGEPVPDFHYEDPGMLAVIGRKHAVADIFGRRFTGFFAWILWALVHVAKLVGFRNRALVLVNWAWNYIFFERAVRLILPTEADAVEAEPVPHEALAPPDPLSTGSVRREESLDRHP